MAIYEQRTASMINPQTQIIDFGKALSEGLDSYLKVDERKKTEARQKRLEDHQNERDAIADKQWDRQQSINEAHIRVQDKLADAQASHLTLEAAKLTAEIEAKKNKDMIEAHDRLVLLNEQESVNQYWLAGKGREVADKATGTKTAIANGNLAQSWMAVDEYSGMFDADASSGIRKAVKLKDMPGTTDRIGEDPTQLDKLFQEKFNIVRRGPDGKPLQKMLKPAKYDDQNQKLQDAIYGEDKMTASEAKLALASGSQVEQQDIASQLMKSAIASGPDSSKRMAEMLKKTIPSDILPKLALGKIYPELNMSNKDSVSMIDDLATNPASSRNPILRSAFSGIKFYQPVNKEGNPVGDPINTRSSVSDQLRQTLNPIDYEYAMKKLDEKFVTPTPVVKTAEPSSASTKISPSSLARVARQQLKSGNPFIGASVDAGKLIEKLSTEEGRFDFLKNMYATEIELSNANEAIRSNVKEFVNAFLFDK